MSSIPGGLTHAKSCVCASVGARDPRTVRIGGQAKQSKAKQSKAKQSKARSGAHRHVCNATRQQRLHVDERVRVAKVRHDLHAAPCIVRALIHIISSSCDYGTLIRLIGIASFARSARLVSACCSTARPSTPKRPSHWKADARVRGKRGTERRGDIAHTARAPKGLRRGQGRSGPLPAAAPRAAAATAGRSSVCATARRTYNSTRAPASSRRWRGRCSGAARARRAAGARPSASASPAYACVRAHVRVSPKRNGACQSRRRL